MEKLPEGPFFDLIREWNETVRLRREQHGNPPPGTMLVSKEFLEAYTAELKRKD